MEHPLEIGAHFTLHPVYLEGVEVLTYNAPRLAGVGAVADYLGCDHERRDKEAVTTRTSKCSLSLVSKKIAVRTTTSGKRVQWIA